MSRAQQLPHVRAEPAPASSKRDPLLARPELGSNAGWASGESRFKKEKKNTAQQQPGEWSEKMGEPAPCQSCAKVGQEVCQAQEEKFPMIDP